VADFIGVMNIFATRREGNMLRIGQYAISAPDGLNSTDQISIAVRPEDFLPIEPDKVPSNSFLWQGTIDQSIDLGHYRKVLVIVPGLFSDEATAISHRLKIYTPKASELKEGTRIWLYPTRYLVYSDRGDPIEVHNQALKTLDEIRREDLSRSSFAFGK
jgi:ABC-type Fe3+/spermidine/putrescine transport system ATPase subunit